MEFKKLSKMCIEGVAQWGQHEFFLAPDVHFDNPKCDRALFKKMMDECKARNAFAIFNGDFLCLMEGRYDPRRSRNGIRPEYNKNNYLDLVINDAADWLAPYAKNIAMFGYGNHETKVCKNLDTDPIERLIERIYFLTGHRIQKNGYHGYLLLKFYQFGDRSKGGCQSSVIYHHHGRYGGAITKGTLGVGRHASVVPDADVIFTGHTHDNWSMEHPRYILSKKTGQVTVKPQIHLKSGTLKEEFATDQGWAVETIVMPKSLTGWWLKYNVLQTTGGKREVNITYEPAR